MSTISLPVPVGAAPAHVPRRARHGRRWGYWLAPETCDAIVAGVIAIVGAGALSIITMILS